MKLASIRDQLSSLKNKLNTYEDDLNRQMVKMSEKAEK